MILDAPHDLLHELIGLADEETRRQHTSDGDEDRAPDELPGTAGTHKMRELERQLREQEAGRSR